MIGYQFTDDRNPIKLDEDEVSVASQERLGHMNILNTQICPRYWRNSTIQKRTSISIQYRCYSCLTDYSTNSGTFLDKAKLSTAKFMLIFNYYLDEFTVKQTLKLIRQNIPNAKANVKTVRRWFQKLDLLISPFIQREMTNQRFDGEVEIDETLIYRVKKSLARGRPIRNRFWLFGIKSRVNKRFVIYATRFRDRDTLTRLILRHVERYSIIFTDCYSIYVNNRVTPKRSLLSKYGYLHLFVNHSEHFVHPILNHIHTNTIERMWRSVKQFTRIFTPKKFIDIAVIKFYFVSVYSRDERERLLVRLMQSKRDEYLRSFL